MEIGPIQARLLTYVIRWWKEEIADEELLRALKRIRAEYI